MFWKYTVSQVHNPGQQNWLGVCACQKHTRVYLSPWILALNSGTTPLCKVRDGSKKQRKQILWHGFLSDCCSRTLYGIVCALRGKALPLSGTFEVYERRSEESIGPRAVRRSCYRISHVWFMSSQDVTLGHDANTMCQFTAM